ncbi:MAG: TonB-dependent receptor, partial [Opitutus sp.]
NYRFFTANGNDAGVSGVEASATYALTRDWSLYATVAQLESSLDRFTLINGNEGGGRRLANTPRYGYTVGTRYHHPAGWFTTAEWIGRASQYDSNNQNEERRPFHVVNASFGYTWNRWTASLWARNLLGEAYDKRVFFFGNEDPDYIETRYEDRADPRQVGITARYQF